VTRSSGAAVLPLLAFVLPLLLAPAAARGADARLGAEIDRFAASLKDLAVELFGTNDKPALVVGIHVTEEERDRDRRIAAPDAFARDPHDPLDLLVRERPGLDAPDTLAFQQFMEQFHQGQDQLSQAVLEVVLVQVDSGGLATRRSGR